jgi:DNA-binding LytR/AlgR family response regulator
MITGENYSVNEMQTVPDHSSSNTFNKKKLRLVVQKGMEFIPLFLRDIVIIYTENKLTYVLDKDGRKYISEKNLADVISQLDKEKFFRANRQYIVNMEYIRCYRPYGRSKLQVEVAFVDNKHFIIVSQENAPHFRNWISEA